MSTDDFIERRILIGLVTSDDYIKEVYKIWDPKLFASSTAATLATWCIDYFEQYQKAPGPDIQGIFTEKLRKGLSQDKAEDIEDILDGLSDEYQQTNFNVQYLLDQTKDYFERQNLLQFAEEIKGAVESGDSLSEAQKTALNYKPTAEESLSSIDPFSDSSAWKRAFEEQPQPLIRFGKQLGHFWDEQWTRGGLVALMGPEKVGKTFLLLEIATRGLADGNDVAFFQAGDMTEDQQVRRLGIHLAGRSDKERYCQGFHVPVVDCAFNQLDSCSREERECDFGPFEGWEEKELREIAFKDLKEAFQKYQDEYSPCRNCKWMRGAPWFIWQDPVDPLTWKEAYKAARKFHKRHKSRFKLATYPNETLTIAEMKTVLDNWEKQEDFVPSIIIVDYADILDSDPDIRRMDMRHQVNKTWQRMRSLAHARHCLLATATQASADSYGKKLISKKDFTEDKRKLSHVTALYGLNQTDEEKKIGIMRLNELVIREDDFDPTNQIKVLQRLQMGRPYIGSFY